MLNVELIKKKFTKEYIFDENIVWVNAEFATLHWWLVFDDTDSCSDGLFYLLITNQGQTWRGQIKLEIIQIPVDQAQLSIR